MHLLQGTTSLVLALLVTVYKLASGLPALSNEDTKTFTQDHPQVPTNVSYAGHSVLRVWPDHQKHVDILESFRQHEKDGLEFWRQPGHKDGVDIRIPPQLQEKTLHRIKRSRMRFRIMVPDLQSQINEERRSWRALPRASNFNLTVYHTYDEIMSWLQDLSHMCGPVCSTFNIGRSFEGRPLKVIRIGIPQPHKPAVWIDAGIHAREWIAPSTAIYLIDKLLNERHSDMNVRYLLNQYTWYFLPIANPDGYAYTWETDRLWRKTRSVRPNSPCRGADPNRNWGFHWSGPGTSSDPCSENYHGMRPFSEPETRSMSNFLWQLKDQLALYLTLHSYGQYWLTPWGFTYDVPEDFNDMLEVGELASSAMGRAIGTQYRVGASSRMLYLASGGSDDWVKGVAGVKYSYTVELRDTGKRGFILPPDMIATTGQEMYDALKVLTREVERRNDVIADTSGAGAK